MAPNFGTRKRDGPKLVYHNDRLLIGWRTSKMCQAETTSETHKRTKAWLGQIGPEESAGDYKSAHVAAIGFLRVYVSSDGPDQLYNDVMGVDKRIRPSWTFTRTRLQSRHSWREERLGGSSLLTVDSPASEMGKGSIASVREGS